MMLSLSMDRQLVEERKILYLIRMLMEVYFMGILLPVTRLRRLLYFVLGFKNIATEIPFKQAERKMFYSCLNFGNKRYV